MCPCRVCCSCFEAGQALELRVGDRNGFEQTAHSGAILAGQAHQRGVDRAGIIGRSRCLERCRALLDPEPALELALRQRPVHPRAHAFSRLRQRLKIHVRGEVDQARREQRLGELMAADGL